jgi:hypothetical protein
MKIAIGRVVAISAVAMGLSVGLFVAADTAATNSAITNAPPRTYSGYVFDHFEWINAKSLPKGATMAILEGAPNKAGAYTVRYKFPAGYRIPLGWRSADERVTVLTGVLNIGLSPSYDKDNSRSIAAGSFAFMPANMRFVAWTDEETVIQVHGIGPADIHFVYPADP